MPNLRVVGGIKAVPNSWPAHVYLTINYKAVNLYLKPLDENMTATLINVTVKYACGGTLINRFTVLTASHCILDKYFLHNYKNRTYLINITSNSFYPSLESMVSVFIGINDTKSTNKSDLDRNVSRIIKVQQ